MRNRIRQFMAGRYGSDQLNRALSFVIIILLVVSLIGQNTLLSYLWYVALVLLLVSYYRTLSRDIYRRQKENQWFLDKTERLRSRFRIQRDQFRQRQDYKFFDCPQCHTTVRVPKGKGTLNITCPKCRERFTRKS